MKWVKYGILALVLLNIPAALLKFVSPALGSLTSYSIFLLLILFYLFTQKSKPNTFLLFIGFCYYLIASFQYYGDNRILIIDTIKFFLVVLLGYELIKKVTKQELFFFLLIGALTIGIETLFFPSHFGRYSGLYINPNVAGFVCIFGYGLVWSLKNNNLKLIGQFVFSLMGLLTFSRTFIILWIAVNLLSIWISVKNVRIFVLGIGLVFTMVIIDQVVGLNNPRFEQLMAIVNNEEVSTTEISEGSRTETWAKFYQDILEKPVFGNGYGTFLGREGAHSAGVHNSYLLVLGESGIITFLLFVGYILFLLARSFTLFPRTPNLFMQCIGFSVFLMANHNFFNFFYIIFCAMWLQYQISLSREQLATQP